LRLIRDGHGGIVENCRAPRRFKQADARRANKTPYAGILEMRSRAHGGFGRETESRRPEPELSWGNCVHETGVLHELKGSHVKKVMKGARSSNAF
jgi:hypothetical protein